MDNNGQDTKRKQAILIDSILGLAAFSEDGRLIARAAYPRDPDAVAQLIDNMANGSLPPQLPPLLEELKSKGYGQFVFTDESLASAVFRSLSLDARHEQLGKLETLPKDPADLAELAGFVENPFEFNEALRAISRALASKRVSSALRGLHPLLSHAVLMIEELDKCINSLSVKTEEWYGLHFPELNRIVQDHRLYIELVVRAGDRAYINSELLQRSGAAPEASERIMNAARMSLGGALRGDDAEVIQAVGTNLLSLNGLRHSLEDYIANLVAEIAPNATELAGPMLAAKLICKAGGLRQLALLPSSKVQILGAEKALFRAMKTGGRPPKHGLVFQHPFVHSVPRRSRGKAARMLATKLALAARADYFSGRPVGRELKEDLEIGIAELVKDGD